MTAGSTRVPPAFVVAATLAGLLFVMADPATSMLRSVVPLAWRVTSAGSQYPAFGEAMPTILRGLAVAVVVGLVLEVVRRSAPRWFAVDRYRGGPERAVLAALAAGGAVVHGFLARPHNAFPSNSRLHWVQIWFDRDDDYFYALLKLPHYLFYDAPWLLMALNAGVNVLLVAAIVRRDTGRAWAGIAAAATYLVSAQMLLFANSAEDVQLAVTALLLVLWVHGLRRPVAMGFALFVAMLARPAFLLVVPAFVVAEVVSTRHHGRSVAARLGAVARDRYTLVALGVFAALFVAWHGMLGLRGDGWLMTGGQVISRGHFGLEPREIDGFTISAFSGAYLGHMLWLYPAPLLAAAAVVVARWRRLSANASGTVGLVLAFGAATLLLLEGFPMMYFNIRYIAYLFPLLVVVAWLLPAVWTGRSGAAVPVLVAVVLVASGAAAPHRELDIRATILEDPLTGLFPQRQELREELAGDPVYVSVGRLQRRNVVAYLVRRPLEDLRPVDDEADVRTGGWLVTDDEELFPQLEPFAESGAARVLRVPPPD